MQFELIDKYHARAKVFGGWIVESVSDNPNEIFNGIQPHISIASCFVPDPAHEWILDNDNCDDANDANDEIAFDKR